MQTKHFEIHGIKLPAVLWMPDGDPKAILLIIHGMTEHIGRYETFAQQLTACGIVVAGYDLRGHGKNPSKPDIASFGENGWDASLQDIHSFFDQLGVLFPDLPRHILGFSLGSFLLREYLDKWPDHVASAIIMGTGMQPGAVLSVMAAIVKGQIKRSGFDGVTPLVRQLSFGTYNQRFKPNRTELDWLCADEKQLDCYIADPLCRKDISSGLFWQLLCAMKRTGSKTACINWNKTMPVMLLSGANDPVGGFGKGVQAVRKQLVAAGFKNVSMYLLPAARHIVLCEEQSGAAQQARDIICDWLTAM